MAYWSIVLCGASQSIMTLAMILESKPGTIIFEI